MKYHNLKLQQGHITDIPFCIKCQHTQGSTREPEKVVPNPEREKAELWSYPWPREHRAWEESWQEGHLKVTCGCSSMQVKLSVENLCLGLCLICALMKPPLMTFAKLTASQPHVHA